MHGAVSRGAHSGLDVRVRRRALQPARQVHDTHVHAGHAEGHARQLAVQRGNDLHTQAQEPAVSGRKRGGHGRAASAWLCDAGGRETV